MVRFKGQFSALPEYFKALEELHEVGEHSIANKLVYVDKLSDSNDDPFGLVSKINVDLDRWIEFHVRLGGYRKPYYVGAIRLARDGRHVGWKPNGHLSTRCIDWDTPVLVNIPEPMQLPQFRGLVGVPVVVWLKKANDLSGVFMDTDKGVFEKSPPFSIVDWNDGEASPVISGSPFGERERTSQVIQRRSEAGQGVARDQTKFDVDGRRVEVYDVLSSFKIVLCPHSMSLALQKLPDRSVQSVQVFLRPTQLQCGVDLWEP